MFSFTIGKVNFFLFQGYFGKANSDNIDLEEFKRTAVLVLSMSIHVLYFFFGLSNEHGNDCSTFIPAFWELLYSHCRNITF